MEIPIGLSNPLLPRQVGADDRNGQGVQDGRAVRSPSVGRLSEITLQIQETLDRTDAFESSDPLNPHAEPLGAQLQEVELTPLSGSPASAQAGSQADTKEAASQEHVAAQAPQDDHAPEQGGQAVNNPMGIPVPGDPPEREWGLRDTYDFAVRAIGYAGLGAVGAGMPGLALGFGIGVAFGSAINRYFARGAEGDNDGLLRAIEIPAIAVVAADIVGWHGGANSLEYAGALGLVGIGMDVALTALGRWRPHAFDGVIDAIARQNQLGG